MPIERPPKNLNYKPDGGTPYKVKTNDDWRSVAKAHGIAENWLVYFNCGTTDPGEVNWFLRHKVGCVRPTHDQKNWMFTSEARPGIIYVPPAWKRPAFLPPVAVEDKVPYLSKMWAGLGKAHSGDLFVIGAHDLTAKLYNLGDEPPNVKNAVININGFKFGPGLGADVSAVFVLAHGYSRAPEMNGVSGDWDFDIAIGAKLSDVLKDIKGLGKVIDGVEKYKKMRYIAENAIKNRLIVEPGIYNIPIPFAGVGLHVWGGYKFGDVSLFSSGIGIP